MLAEAPALYLQSEQRPSQQLAVQLEASNMGVVAHSLVDSEVRTNVGHLSYSVHSRPSSSQFLLHGNGVWARRLRPAHFVQLTNVHFT